MDLQPGLLRSHIGRRQFLIAGALGSFTLADYLRSSVLAGTADRRARSAILIWLNGGLSHHDTFDPKPGAVPEIRGQYGTIATRVAGVRFAESLPSLSRQMHQLVVVRSVTHANSAHDAGQAHMLSGYDFAPGHNYPSIAAVIGHEVGSRGGLPAFLAIPNESSAYMHAGHLGSAFNPFAVGSNPNDPQFQVRDVDEPANMTPERSNRRQRLLQQVDDVFRALDSSGAIESVDRFTAQAYDLMRSPTARAALDLTRVDLPTRERYGRTQIGQSCLLARRLVEAGVPFVTVASDDWDHHQDLYPRLQSVEMLPAFDRGYAALIEDLEQRGLLQSTLVIFMTEFGRTPRINSMRGRDHWSRAFSVALAGGGVRGGQVIGASDAEGAFPQQRPVTPEDIAHSVYRLLGLDPEKELLSTSGRRIQIVRDGQFIRELTG